MKHSPHFSVFWWPSGLKSQVHDKFVFLPSQLQNLFHIPRHVQTRLFGILVGAVSFTGVELNFKVEGRTCRTNWKLSFTSGLKIADFPILVFTWGLPGIISTRFGAQLRKRKYSAFASRSALFFCLLRPERLF